MICYRGDSRRPAAPRLENRSWVTTDADVAAWYGCAHRYILPDDLVVLDLTDLGVGDGENDQWVARWRHRLQEAGVDYAWCDVEVFLTCEREAFQGAVLDAGYEAIRVLQWHADRGGEEPYEALMVLDRAEDAL